MRGWPLVLTLAALFNLPVGLLFMLDPGLVHAAIGMPGAPDIATRALGWCILIFGATYALAAAAPERNRDMIRLGVVGKSGIFVLVTAYWLAGRTTAPIAALAAADLAWVAVFVLFLVSTRRTA